MKSIDEELFRRHQREITPLLERRYIYSGAENFRMYDFRLDDGSLNEDVFRLQQFIPGSILAGVIP